MLHALFFTLHIFYLYAVNQSHTHNYHCLYLHRYFIGPTISGVLTEYGSFGWTFTYFSFACFAVAVVIFVIWIYRYCTSAASKDTKLSADDEKIPMLYKLASSTDIVDLALFSVY